jgi:tRNA(Ile)-lysidine synthase
LAGFTNNFEGLVSLVDHKIRDFSLENQRFALGVSGGADSIALFWVFLDLLKQKKISDLVVFHINFGLRGDESSEDQAFVQGICQAQSVHCEVFQPEPLSPHSSGIQEFARNFRRSVQDQFLAKGFIIALAHNADDVAENVIMRLARGSAAENAAGMDDFSTQIFRPFLGVCRNDIRQRLSRWGKIWREDSSNKTDQYTRNKIRLEVLPVLESLYPGCTKRISDSFLAIRPSKNTVQTDVETLKLPLSRLKDYAEQAISHAIHEFLTKIYAGRSPVARDVIGQITRTVLKLSSGLDGETRVFHLPQGLSMTVGPAELHVFQRE